MKKRIGIIDIGAGNLYSVHNFISKIHSNSFISDSKDELITSDLLIMPGVGSFDYAMRSLKKKDLVNFLKNQILIEKKKYLGICLGLQILGNYSDESNDNKGLGFLPCDIKKISKDKKIILPHVGWNNIQSKTNDVLFKSFNNKSFYFDHSYYLDCPDKMISSYFNYFNQFPSSINYKNIFGFQFHPEKSSKNGEDLFKHFLKIIF